MQFWDHFKRDKHLIIAHRGARAYRAENTMSAFAYANGRCDLVEFDVGFSRDGVAVIIHDDTLERTSDVREHPEFKPPYSVSDYDHDMLKKLDFGSWFVRDDTFGTIKLGTASKHDLLELEKQTILTLEALLIYLKSNRMLANIEIKDMSNTAFDDHAAASVLDIVKRMQMQEYVCISSFNHKYLKQLHDLDPNIVTAALQEKSHPEDLVNYLKKLSVSSYHLDIEITSEALIKELNEAGFYVNVFTVNEQKDIDQLFKWGVKSVFTDFV
ncbi:glycerophosphodiester phosphodiesterase [Sulfurospirillum sp. 1612]|uniref:glycerophosphodiester phosphodiesterase n=1 Tax=Sulfurospirillum sp. 1612 TaxID=3094835 RepID=UPI002F920F35